MDTDVTLTLTSPLVLGGAFSKYGGGTLVLAAPGAAPERNFGFAGTLVLANELSSATGNALLNVQDRATLAGSGIAEGRVTVYRGGRVSPGTADDPVATLTAGELVLHEASSLRFHMGDIAGSDRLRVNGDLTPDGTLFVTALDGFGPGTYRLIDYGGSLADNGLSVGVSVPQGYLYEIDTSAAGQVNLIVLVPEPALAIAVAAMWPLLGARALRRRIRLR